MFDYINGVLGKIIEQFPIVFNSLNDGFFNTLKLFFVTLGGALPLGLIIAFASMSRFKPLKYFTKFIVWIVRGSPLMIQLLIIFYFPDKLFGISIWGGGMAGRFSAAAVAFIFNYACYFSEIYRAGVEGVPVGQTEAGQVLGMSRTQIFFNVTLVQMIKRIIPPMSNEIITLVKDTSLARFIAYEELMEKGYKFIKSGVGNVTYEVWPLFFTAVYYLLFSGLLTILLNRIEKKLSYFRV